MQYTSRYLSPLGRMLLASDGESLTGLWFEGQKYYPVHLSHQPKEQELPVFSTAARWLDVYFDGQNPTFDVPVRFDGTAFQNDVWRILAAIPYGQTLTYGDIAKILAAQRGLAHMSAQAVGGAVGHNPISIIVPCHRVIGTNGSLTGYAGGLDRKRALLALEGIRPKKST